MLVSATTFKARCLALLDDVAETGAELIVTKRGKPVARISAVDEGASLAGSIEILVEEDELLEPVGGPWDAAT